MDTPSIYYIDLGIDFQTVRASMPVEPALKSESIDAKLTLQHAKSFGLQAKAGGTAFVLNFYLINFRWIVGN